jgi:hypothetical protein
MGRGSKPARNCEMPEASPGRAEFFALPARLSVYTSLLIQTGTSGSLAHQVSLFVSYN